MAKYASQTTVSPERSRAEIEQTLTRYGASAFSYGWDGARAAIAFRCDGRSIRFEVAVPQLEDFAYTKAGARRVPEQQRRARDQDERQRWRALALVVKAKLEAVDAGVTTFEQEFLAHVVLPDGSTVGEWMEPQLRLTYHDGAMPAPLARAQLGA